MIAISVAIKWAVIVGLVAFAIATVAGVFGLVPAGAIGNALVSSWVAISSVLSPFLRSARGFCNWILTPNIAGGVIAVAFALPLAKLTAKLSVKIAHWFSR